MRLWAYRHGLIRYAYVLYYIHRLARAFMLAKQVFVILIMQPFLYMRSKLICGKHWRFSVTYPPEGIVTPLSARWPIINGSAPSSTFSRGRTSPSWPIGKRGNEDKLHVYKNGSQRRGNCDNKRRRARQVQSPQAQRGTEASQDLQRGYCKRRNVMATLCAGLYDDQSPPHFYAGPTAPTCHRQSLNTACFIAVLKPVLKNGLLLFFFLFTDWKLSLED